jgi:hypothetical protein
MPISRLAIFVLELVQDDVKRNNFNAASTQARKDMAAAAGVPNDYLDALANRSVPAINEALRKDLKKAGAAVLVIDESRIFPP